MPAYLTGGSPNLLYYRLGSLDGDSCDILGINNYPIADFRYTIDQLSPLKVHPTNTSYFNPEEYYWHFGGQNSSPSKDPPPVSYTKFGSYEICLLLQICMANIHFVEQ